MHGANTYPLPVFRKVKSSTSYRLTQLSWYSAGTMKYRLFVRARCTQLFFFQQNLVVSIRLNRWKPTVRINEARRIKKSILVRDTILIFSLFVSSLNRKGQALRKLTNCNSYAFILVYLDLTTIY